MANYNKNKKDKFLQELYYKCNKRKLELRKARKYKRDSREVGKRSKRED